MFENYNLIKYSLSNDIKGKELTDYILTDIFTRAKLVAPDDAFILYKVSDGETPEAISNRVYGTPYYHWTIMFVNEIHDVYSEWYMGDEKLLEHVKAKYNVVHTITPANINVSTNTFTVTAHKFNPTDPVTITGRELPGGIVKNTPYYISNTTQNTFQLCKVVNNTPLFVTANFASNTFDCGGFTHGMSTGCKVKFLSNSGTYPTGIDGTTEYYIVNPGAQQFQVSLTSNGSAINIENNDLPVGYTLQVILQPLDITSVGAYNITVTCDRTTFPNCYVDEQMNIMSSALNEFTGWDNNVYTRVENMSYMNQLIGEQPSRYAYTSATNKDVIDNGDDSYTFIEKPTYAHEYDAKEIRVMTNLEYETMLNEKNRFIKLLKPEYVKKFVDRFNEVVRG